MYNLQFTWLYLNIYDWLILLILVHVTTTWYDCVCIPFIHRLRTVTKHIDRALGLQMWVLKKVLFDVSNNHAKSVTSKHWLSISPSSRLWSTPVPCRRTRLVMTASSPSRFFLLGASEFHKPRDGKRMISIPWQSWHVLGYVRIFPSWILHSKRCVTGQFLFSHNIFSTMSSHKWAIAPWSLVGQILKVCALDIARPDVVHDFG